MFAALYLFFCLLIYAAKIGASAASLQGHLQTEFQNEILFTILSLMTLENDYDFGHRTLPHFR